MTAISEMSQDATDVHLCIKTYPFYEVLRDAKIPLWHCRFMLEAFLKQCVLLACSEGVTVLDQNTIWCKSKYCAMVYAENQPCGYGTSFYVVFFWDGQYMDSLLDADAECTMRIPPGER